MLGVSGRGLCWRSYWAERGRRRSWLEGGSNKQGPNARVNRRILQILVYGIFFGLGFRSRMKDPYTQVLSKGPKCPGKARLRA